MKKKEKTKKFKVDLLHGITLENILNTLVAELGWIEMGKKININCFNDNPSIKSSLNFLRRTEWARKKVERLYISIARKKLKLNKTSLTSDKQEIK